MGLWHPPLQEVTTKVEVVVVVMVTPFLTVVSGQTDVVVKIVEVSVEFFSEPVGFTGAELLGTQEEEEAVGLGRWGIGRVVQRLVVV